MNLVPFCGKLDAEADHDRHADETRFLFGSITAEAGRFPRRRGDEAVNQRRAERGDIDDLADGCAAQKGHKRRDKRDQPDRLTGNTMSVELAQRRRQHAVSSERIKQAAQRRDVADQARQDQCKQRGHKDPDPRAAEIIFRSVKGRQRFCPAQMVQITYIFQPTAILGGGRP